MPRLTGAPRMGTRAAVWSVLLVLASPADAQLCEYFLESTAQRCEASAAKGPGAYSITDADECLRAALSISATPSTEAETERLANWPYGCYVHTLNRNQLFMNTDDRSFKGCNSEATCVCGSAACTPAPPTPVPPPTSLPPTRAPPTSAPPTQEPPTPAPPTMRPPTPEPPTPRPATPAPPTPAPPTQPPLTPAPATLSPPTLIPPTASPPTPAPPTPLPPTPSPPTQPPPTPAPATLNPPTPAPPTPLPATLSPPTAAPPTRVPVTLMPPDSAAPGSTSAPATSVPRTAAPASREPSTDVPATVVRGSTEVPGAGGGTRAPAGGDVPLNATNMMTHDDTIEALGNTLMGVGVVASVVSGPQGAGVGTLVLLAEATCNPEGRQDWPLALHPTQLRVGGSMAAGVVIGNLALAAVVAVVLWLAVQGATMLNCCAAVRRIEEDVQALLRFPTGAILVFLLLYPGTLLGALVLLLDHTEYLATAGLFGVVVLCLIPARLHHMVRTNVPRTGRGGKAYYRVCREACPEWFLFLIGRGEWVSTRRETHFVTRYQAVLRPHTQRHAWWCTVDLGLTVGVTFAKALNNTGHWSKCAGTHFAAAFLYLVFVIIDIRYQPYARDRDNIIMFVQRLICAFGLAFLSLGFLSKDAGSQHFETGTYFFMAAMVVLLLKYVLDLLTEVYVFCTGRRMAMQEDAWRESSMGNLSWEAAGALRGMGLGSLRRMRGEEGGDELADVTSPRSGEEELTIASLPAARDASNADIAQDLKALTVGYGGTPQPVPRRRLNRYASTGAAPQMQRHSGGRLEIINTEDVFPKDDSPKSEWSPPTGPAAPLMRTPSDSDTNLVPPPALHMPMHATPSPGAAVSALGNPGGVRGRMHGRTARAASYVVPRRRQRGPRSIDVLAVDVNGGGGGSASTLGQPSPQRADVPNEHLATMHANKMNRRSPRRLGASKSHECLTGTLAAEDSSESAELSATVGAGGGAGANTHYRPVRRRSAQPSPIDLAQGIAGDLRQSRRGSCPSTPPTPQDVARVHVRALSNTLTALDDAVPAAGNVNKLSSQHLAALSGAPLRARSPVGAPRTPSLRSVDGDRGMRPKRVPSARSSPAEEQLVGPSPPRGVFAENASPAKAAPAEDAMDATVRRSPSSPALPPKRSLKLASRPGSRNS